MRLNDIDPYDRRFKATLDKFAPELWAHLDLIPSLPSEAQAELLDYYVELACDAQNVRNITLGRQALQEVPRGWLLLHLHESVKGMLDLDDDWHFRRLCEVLFEIDQPLLDRYVKQGLASPNDEVREAAQDFENKRESN